MQSSKFSLHLTLRFSVTVTAALLAFTSLVYATDSPSAGQGTETAAGLDTRYFDTSVRPQDDFYRYVNGKWLDTANIPADKSRFGVFMELRDKSEKQLADIMNDLMKDTAIKPGTDAQRIHDLYASFMNEAKLEALAQKPLRDDLALIEATHDATRLPTLMARLARQGINMPMLVFVHPDNRDSTHYAPDLFQGGLELPDRDYYLKDGEDGTYKKIRDAYLNHIVMMLTLEGLPQPAQSAKLILALETSLAQAHWDKVSNRDPVKTYNKFLVANLESVAPQFDWNGFLQTAGVKGKSDFLLISQPSYITETAKLLQEVPLSTWKIYLKWKVISAAAPYLSKAFADEDFAFNGKIVSGTPEIRARWKRGVGVIESTMGESLGKLYVQKYFPEENKRRMLALVNNLIAAYHQSIDQLDWMSAATKQQAQEKLAKLAIKIGYPNQWRDYSALQIRADDLWGNVVRASEFEYQRQINKLGNPIDRNEWHMTPQTVNAYYNAEMNEIVFPAAILQPPFFNVQADDAFNYGAIGAVIGHEISHGFDDQGSQFDGEGDLRDWWTAEDHAKFATKTSALVQQYAAYETVPGYHLNGKLTLGENIADLSGLAIAFKAYQLSLDHQSAPMIDGMTGEQRFFLGWAAAWRETEREKEAIRLATVDPHSPPRFRVRGTVVNMDAFYRAFDVKPDDKMYVPPEQRISIW